MDFHPGNCAAEKGERRLLGTNRQVCGPHSCISRCHNNLLDRLLQNPTVQQWDQTEFHREYWSRQVNRLDPCFAFYNRPSPDKVCRLISPIWSFSVRWKQVVGKQKWGRMCTPLTMRFAILTSNCSSLLYPWHRVVEIHLTQEPGEEGNADPLVRARSKNASDFPWFLLISLKSPDIQWLSLSPKIILSWSSPDSGWAWYCWGI